MKIIRDNRIDIDLIGMCVSGPKIFTKSTDRFWDDEHISEQMLKLHLDPNVEAASRTKETIEAETDFIIKLTDMDSEKSVLDLGCGPGLYVREFAKTGARVTGVDFSDRSVNYATQYVGSEYANTRFVKMNYLDLNFQKSFDIATLIYYDFCALNTDEQHHLLANVYDALNDNGIFVFDVITETWVNPLLSGISVASGGFWSPKPYIEIVQIFTYDEPRTEGIQYTIIGEDGTTRVFRLYHRLFSLDEITHVLDTHGFKVEKVYRNLKGDSLDKGSETFGIVARKV
ncbi:MAG: class I SAM-dependent methyltransferase [Chitinophagales bacterium]